MTVERNYETITVKATADLTSMQFRAITLAGIQAATTATAKGILRNKAASGDHATLIYKGQFKALAGGAVNSGAQVGVTTSGWLIAVTTSAYVGIALATAASGDMFPVLGDFNMGLIA